MDLLTRLTIIKEIYYDEIIKPFSDSCAEYPSLLDIASLSYYPFLKGVDRYPIYFDHRVADDKSTFTYEYELGRVCKPGKPVMCLFLNSLLENTFYESKNYLYMYNKIKNVSYG
jgi:hypothetical protein